MSAPPGGDDPRAPSLRAARLADADAIARLATQLGYPSSAAEVRVRLEVLVGDEDHAVLVAESAPGEVIAWAQGSVVRTVESEPRAELAGLVVDESRRGTGVGALLVAAVSEWARAKGLARLRVRTNVVRERTHRFYLARGFVEAKRQLVFEKDL